MSAAGSRFLLVYLLALLAGTVWMICTLWSTRPKLSAETLPIAQCGTSPSLQAIYPRSIPAGSLSDLLVVGCGFSPATQAKVNGTQRPAIFIDSSHVRATLSVADTVSPGLLLVSVSGDGADFGASQLRVVPPAVEWIPFESWSLTISLELQLLLLVLATGAFGACIYGLKSLANYRGDHKLYQSWFLFYLVQPFQGAGMAFLAYLVVRGGFLSGAGAEKTVNQFGICAIAGLAGTFSDTAYLKLREVFCTLFKPHDDRGGKLSG